MGGINFAWLAVLVLSPDWLSHKRDFFCRRLGEAARAWGGMRVVPRLCIVYPGICLTTEENHGKPQSGYPKGARLISAERDSFNSIQFNSIYFMFGRSKGGCNPQDIEHVNIHVYKCVQVVNSKQEMSYNNKV
jgi:hypothetical protein